ncbi:addiction module toxin, RelE/StbE family [Spirochaetia bacterium]|nr:addiction module toxin, RelE/StbE family [Spirochaetia bacterium]
MKDIIYSDEFFKSWKKLQKKRYDYDKLEQAISILKDGASLPGKYSDHPLVGNWKGYRECHIEANWLLVYKKTETDIILVKTCTHDDL